MQNDFAKFFNPGKSPHTQWKFNPATQRMEIVYWPKNVKSHPDKLIWDSASKGTAYRVKNGYVTKETLKAMLNGKL